MLSDKEKAQIRKEARQILGKFGKDLAKVRVKEVVPEASESVREECAGDKRDEDFRKQLFANAPEVDGDCLVSEKKKW